MTNSTGCLDSAAMDRLRDALAAPPVANDLPMFVRSLNHLQGCAACAGTFRSRVIPKPPGDDAIEAAESGYYEVEFLRDHFAQGLQRRLARPVARVISAGEVTARATNRRWGHSGRIESRTLPRFEIRQVEEPLTDREREAFDGHYVHDFPDAGVARALDTTPNNVRQTRYRAVQKVLRSVVSSVFRISTAETELLTAYYGAPVSATEPAAMVAEARRRAMLGALAGADVDRLHFETMAKLVATARRLDLHHRNAAWKTIFLAYFRAGQAARPDPLVEPEVVVAEFQAMTEILSKYIVMETPRAGEVAPA